MSLNMSLLYEESGSRTMTQAFYGLNKNLRSADGEFFDMKNLTSDHAPVLAVRNRRYVPTDWEAKKPVSIVTCVGVAEKGKTRGVAWIDEAALIEPNTGEELPFLVMGENKWGLKPYGYTPGDHKTIVKLRAYLIIVPDMIYVNTVDVTKAGRIEDQYVDAVSTFKLEVCNYKGETPTFVQSLQPNDADDEVKNGDTWLKTVENTDIDSPELFEYDEASDEWYKIESYIKISAFTTYVNEAGIPMPKTTNFVFRNPVRAGDSIRISGLDESVNGVKKVMSVTESRGNKKKITEIILEGIINDDDGGMYVYASQESPVTIERALPNMDLVCEAGNRLWGCRYGDDGQGNFVNEIYCSARGDLYRWIAGEATDEDAPVTFSIGTDGPWTGCVNYGGVPTFFKENTMYRVGGYGASGFALQEMPCMGVQAGAERSLAVVNNVLYYKSAAGVMAYDGSVPINVSDKLGRISRYNKAVGGACGEKYYISMWRTDGEGNTYDPVLYALDTEKGLWHKEDEIECESMASDVDNLYFVEMGRRGDTVTHTIKAVRIPDDVDASAHGESSMIPWYAETGVIGLESPDTKYISRLTIRLHLDTGASVRVFVQYDSSGFWKQIAGTQASAMKTISMPIVPMRCDHMRLRLEGVGGCKVYSITKTVESGEEA